MRKIIRLQPSAYVDQIRGGHEMTKLPYPFYVAEDGSIGRQDFWKGRFVRVVGFAADLHVEEINLWWSEAVRDPQRAVGMYVVTADYEEAFETHPTAVERVEVIEKAGSTEA